MQTHVYTSAVERTRANEKCCGTSRVSSGLSCCNGNGYNPLTQVCADQSDVHSGESVTLLREICVNEAQL